METIAESIERGLDAELNYTEEITLAVNAILPSPPHTPAAKRDLTYALEVLQTLKVASVKFMKAFHGASILINEVNAEVGIAEGRPKEEVIRERLRADEEAEMELKERVGVVEGDWAVIERGVKEALEILKDLPDVEEGVVAVDNSINGPRPGAGGAELSALERAKMRNQARVL